MKTSSILSLAWAAASLAVSAPSLSAANWPQWRGPDFNGSSPETGLPSSLDKTNNLRWQFPMPGQAGSTPVIFGDRVFITVADAQKNLVLQCIDRKEGKLLWQQQVGEGDRFTSSANNMASASPVTDGKKVIAMFGTGDLAAYDMDGKKLWSRNIAGEYGRFAINWLYGSSPLLFPEAFVAVSGGAAGPPRERLYIQVIQTDTQKYPQSIDDKPNRDSYVLCLDSDTGKNIWRKIRRTDAFSEGLESYTTPIPFETGHPGEISQPQILIAGGGCVTAHDAGTGEEIWRCGGMNDRHQEFWRLITTPVTGAGLIFVSSPKRDPFFAIRGGGRGDVSKTHVAWKMDKHSPDVCTPLFYRDHLYVLDGDSQLVLCLEPKTGEIKWQGKLPSRENFKASPTGADGKIYCVGEKGTVFVLQAGDEFKILSVSEFGEGPDRGSIAVAQGNLFLRTQKALYCFGNK